MEEITSKSVSDGTASLSHLEKYGTDEDNRETQKQLILELLKSSNTVETGIRSSLQLFDRTRL